MQTLKELYKIGPGPSSSHTLAPARACRLYLENYPETESVKVNLYGSLSLTGKGHFTDKIIMDTFAPRKCDVAFKLDWEQPFPNGFTMPEIQQAYESILDTKFDRRNFRRKFLSLGLITDTNKTVKFNGTKPAKLYKFKNKIAKDKNVF